MVSDDEIRASIEGAQLRLQRERGTDLTIFSPRASWMGHHLGNAHTSRFWSENQNELVRRVCDLFPANFAPVCQLPQSPGAPVDGSVRELRRCVAEMGFVGCNVNPDPSGGFWDGPPLSDRHWWPLWEALCELDVPAMIHVSAACNPNFQTTGSHYLGADTTAFVQALTSGFMRDFPGLRWIIPHGGGAVPYHWGRFRGMGGPGLGFRRPARARLVRHLRVPPARHRPAARRVPLDNVLFASEMVGAVRRRSGDRHHYDDTKFYVDHANLDDGARRQLFHDNALRVFPRLAAFVDGSPADQEQS